MHADCMFICKCIRLIDGMPSVFDYIGPWYGWKKIDANAAVYYWRKPK